MKPSPPNFIHPKPLVPKVNWRKIAISLIGRSASANSLDLIPIFGVPVEDFQFVDPATQAASELSLKPKVKAAKSPS
jgi:hypothetical protein